MGSFNEWRSPGTTKYKLAICTLCICCAGYTLFIIQPFSVPAALEVGGSESKMANFFDIRPHVRMKRRTQQIKERCVNFRRILPFANFTRNDMPGRLLISDRFNIMGCKAAKVASTNLQRIFYILNGLTNDTDTGHVNKGAARKHTNEFFRKKNKYTSNDLIYRLKTFTTFMFVRHPLERLVSAYRDQKPNGYFRPLRKKGKLPTFSEFIDDIVVPSRANKKALKPLHSLCKPCEVQYDFVGSLDDFDDDITTILTAVGAGNAVTIPERNETGYKQRKSSTVVRDYYRDIDLHKIEKIESIYEKDYLIFGFKRLSNIK